MSHLYIASHISSNDVQSQLGSNDSAFGLLQSLCTYAKQGKHYDKTVAELQLSISEFYSVEFLHKQDVIIISSLNSESINKYKACVTVDTIASNILPSYTEKYTTDTLYNFAKRYYFPEV